jgi:hypothetical protein
MPEELREPQIDNIYREVKYIAYNGENVSIQFKIIDDDTVYSTSIGGDHYNNIMKLVEAGELTIADADE